MQYQVRGKRFFSPGRVDFFILRSLVFSRALGCEIRRRPACTPPLKYGSGPGAVARGLGVHSRLIWQVVVVRASAHLEPRHMELAELLSSSPFFSTNTTTAAR